MFIKIKKSFRYQDYVRRHHVQILLMETSAPESSAKTTIKA